MTEVVELVVEEIVVFDAGGEGELVEIEFAAGLEIVEVAAQGAPGPKGEKGDKGDAGSYDGLVAEVTPDPLLLFENALL